MRTSCFYGSYKRSKCGSQRETGMTGCFCAGGSWRVKVDNGRDCLVLDGHFQCDTEMGGNLVESVKKTKAHSLWADKLKDAKQFTFQPN